jgi:uncharacterized protein (DUF111 family)
MQQPARLVQFFIDHLTGEEVGHLIENLYGLGSANVQAIPTVGKKNRPGHVILVDLGSDGEMHAVADLAAQFGVFGFHVIETTHHYREVVCTEEELTVRHQGREMKARLRLKRSGVDGGADGVLRVEFDDLANLTERIRGDWGVVVGLARLRQRVETLLSNDRQDFTLEFD